MGYTSAACGGELVSRLASCLDRRGFALNLVAANAERRALSTAAAAAYDDTNFINGNARANSIALNWLYITLSGCLESLGAIKAVAREGSASKLELRLQPEMDSAIYIELRFFASGFLAATRKHVHKLSLTMIARAESGSGVTFAASFCGFLN